MLEEQRFILCTVSQIINFAIIILWAVHVVYRIMFIDRQMMMSLHSCSPIIGDVSVVDLFLFCIL